MHPMKVWVFRDAPEELKKLSTNGGDEDWLVEVPPNIGSLPIWMETYSFDAGGEPQIVEHPTKPFYRVVIGSH